MSAKQSRKRWAIAGALGCVGIACLCLASVWFLFLGGNEISARVARPPDPVPLPRVAISAQNAGKLQLLYQFAVTDTVGVMAWSPDSRWLVIDSYHIPFSPEMPPRYDSLQWFDVVNGQVAILYSDMRLEFGHFPHIAFSPDGQTLLYQTGKSIRFWDVPHGHEARTQSYASENDADAAFSQVVPTLQGPKMPQVKNGVVTSWSHDSKTVALKIFDPKGDRLVLFDVASGNQQPLEGAVVDDYVRTPFSPDDSLVASAAESSLWVTFRLAPSQVYVWDTHNGRRYELSGAYGIGRSVEFSPDGRFLAIGWVDGTVQLWGIRP